MKNLRSVTALKILLPILIVWLLASFVITPALISASNGSQTETAPSETETTTSEELGEALGQVLGATVIVVLWFFTALPPAIALAVVWIVLLCNGKKYGAIVACLVVVCISAALVTVYSVYSFLLVEISALFAVVPAVNIALIATVLALSAVAVKTMRKQNGSMSNVEANTL